MRFLPAAPLLLALLACREGSRALAPISLEPLVALGATSGDGAMATWPRVSPRHPLGYRILVPQPGAVPALPLVYDDDGRFLQALGTLGTGARDFREPQVARIGPHDSVWVFDAVQGILVFDPDRHWIRTIPLGMSPWDAQVLPDGRILLASTSTARPFPLQLITRTGAVDRELPGDSIAQSIHSPRRILLAPDGTVWTLPMQFRWRLEHWDTLGNSLGAIERRPAWFPPYTRSTEVSRDVAPQPTLQDAWFDADGRLWILGKVADPKWYDGLGTADGGAVAITDPDRVADTILEVIDPATGRVLAEARFDVSYPFAVEPGVIMRVTTSAEGWHRAELMRVRLDSARVTLSASRTTP